MTPSSEATSSRGGVRPRRAGIRALSLVLLVAGLAAAGLARAIVAVPDVATAAATPSTPAPAAQAPGPQRPALAVLIVVYQLRGGLLDRFAPRLDGGLARLLREGVIFEQAHLEYGLTETGPGHATIATGRPPAEHGIIANAWFDRQGRERVNCVGDEKARFFSGKGGASPRRLLATGLADWLKAASPSSKVVGIAGKDRSAILLAGRRPEAAYWFDTSTGRFTTSRYYGPSEPGLLSEFAMLHPTRSLACSTWRPLDEVANLPEAGPDESACEPAGKSVFPHPLPCAEQSAPPSAPEVRKLWSELRFTPAFDHLTLDLAETAVERLDLGADEAPDLLALGLSGTDYVGHQYGPDSQEMLDQMRRLDRRLGRLLQVIEAKVGAGRLLVALTADHGVAQCPEGKPGALRVIDGDLRKRLEAALEKSLGAGKWVEEMIGFDIWLGGAPADYARIETAAVAALRAEPGVAHVYRRAELEGVGTGSRAEGQPVPKGSRPEHASTGTDPYLDAMRASWRSDRGPDLRLRMREGDLLTSLTSGSDHGSPYAYDRHVTLIVRAPGVAAGRHREPVDVARLAPTLAHLLGAPAPRDLPVAPLPGISPR